MPKSTTWTSASGGYECSLSKVCLLYDLPVANLLQIIQGNEGNPDSVLSAVVKAAASWRSGLPSRWPGGILPQTTVEVLLVTYRNPHCCWRLSAFYIAQVGIQYHLYRLSCKLGKNVVLQSWLWSCLKVSKCGEETKKWPLNSAVIVLNI